MRSLIALCVLSFPSALCPLVRALPQDKLTPVTLSIQDASGAPLKSVLLILQNLDNHQRETSRSLTDENGKTPPLNLHPGLYRAIATTPYGNWQTQVREFLVSNEPVHLALKLDPMATHGNGDIVALVAKHISLRVLQSDGSPAAGALVLARDREATLHLERWYKSDDSGQTTIEVIGNPLVVVIVFENTLVTNEISPETAQKTIRLPRG
jgi:hypothetical protein